MAKDTFQADTFASDTFASGCWRGVGVSNRHTVTMDGMCRTAAVRGLNADSTRTVIATITPGDASVVYVFDETEVS